jgi:hypothetical protein
MIRRSHYVEIQQENQTRRNIIRPTRHKLHNPIALIASSMARLQVGRKCIRQIIIDAMMYTRLCAPQTDTEHFRIRKVGQVLSSQEMNG